MMRIDGDVLLRAFHERLEYQRIFIRKRNNPKKKRVLHVPPPVLKEVQRKISDWMNKNIRWSEHVFGFVPMRSHQAAARRHYYYGKTLLLRCFALFTVDFKDAFHTVTSKQVLSAFHDELGLGYATAEWLMRLTTHNRHLPQGAPSSPAVFNLVLRRLDGRLSDYAELNGYRYTRYADEIAFSSRSKPIPLARRREIMSLCHRAGFVINQEKIRYREGDANNFIMNGMSLRFTTIRLPKRNINSLRSFLHHALSDTHVNLKSVSGKLAYVKSFDSDILLNGRLSKAYMQLIQKYHNLVSLE